jgi:N-acetyl sugar amidotransferase
MTFKHSNLELQIKKTPKEVMWCKRCTISNQRPRIQFDKEGICSACNYSEYKNKINWKKREDELLFLLDKHRKKNGEWDVIVPSSGGKDSGYVAHQLRFKYNMNPLTVTWAPLEYTNIGWRNLQSNIGSGFTNLLCTPNGKFQRKLSRLCFEELGDAFHVFVLGQISYPLQIAKKFNVPLIFYGENGELEYAGDHEHQDKPYKSYEEFIKQHYKGVAFDQLLSFGLKNKDYLSEKDFAKSDLNFYKIPNLEDLKRKNIVGHHYFSYFHKWIPQENFYYCAEHTGYKPNPERSEGTYSKYASLDDKMDGMHFYMRYIKFGLGRCADDAAHEVRDGHIAREEGIALMKKYEGEFPQKYFQEFLEYLDTTQTHFWDVVDSWRSKHLWKKIGNKWELRHPIK